MDHQISPNYSSGLQNKLGSAALGSGATGSTKQITEDMVMAKRDILGELVEGVTAMKSHREGKLTLRSYKVEVAPPPKVDSKLIRDTRKRLCCSRAVFARELRINERTLEKWEQGRADKRTCTSPLRCFESKSAATTPMIGLDTNVLIRYLTQDDPVQSAKATEILERRLRPTNPGFVSVVAMVETVWVLDRAYGLATQEIATAVERLLHSLLNQMNRNYWRFS
jgi:DNA-binding transcriptional regulator YiaG